MQGLRQHAWHAGLGRRRGCAGGTFGAEQAHQPCSPLPPTLLPAGDSGGPLFYAGGIGNDTVVGLTSWGETFSETTCFSRCAHGQAAAAGWVPGGLPVAARGAAGAAAGCASCRVRVARAAHWPVHASGVRPLSMSGAAPSRLCVHASHPPIPGLSRRYPSVYTDVAFMRGWIDAHVQVRRGLPRGGAHAYMLDS